ncbi:hypothetical protein [Mucilaginibacter sp. KACC 22063]|uniref:hypothetical protein n=1 Tax=Mucilaginibacter sp. KACC 22063 TaxID=3025666 RepID=UPI0023671A98|nr:hypothetical protein [Mucilaginibacter sp. KACC 22063]WDF56448.1 hypothetical protein PQ461_05210 [Mucilaginibacter sp. KACC 22063]
MNHIKKLLSIFKQPRPQLDDNESVTCWKFDGLLKNLNVLSLPADRQKAIMGYGCIADEMAEDFNTYFTLNRQEYLEKGLLDQQQCDQLDKLDSLLEKYSGDGNTGFWDDQQLDTNKDWQSVREIAKHILIVLRKDNSDIGYS